MVTARKPPHEEYDELVAGYGDDTGWKVELKPPRIIVPGIGTINAPQRKQATAPHAVQSVGGAMEAPKMKKPAKPTKPFARTPLRLV